MKPNRLIILSCLLTICLGCYDYSHHGHDWHCGLCSSGHRQSPINIDSMFLNHVKEPECTGIDFKFYNKTEVETVNNGNTFQSDVTFSTFALIDQDRHHSHYNVSQFHFHCPSEHSINGIKYDLEIHIVAKRIDGDSQGITVIGILFDITDDESEEAELFKEYVFPSEEEGAHVHQMAMDFTKIFDHVLSDNTFAFRYKGSLTTGSCAEDVNWYVVEDPMKITREKYNRFHKQWSNTKDMPEGNNRETQPVNGRPIEIVRFCSSYIDFES